jgi:hypothetical protein
MMKKTLVVSCVLMSLAIHGADSKSNKQKIIYDKQLATFSGYAVIFSQDDDRERFGIVEHTTRERFGFIDHVYILSELEAEKERRIYASSIQPVFITKASREQYRDKVVEVSDELHQRRSRTALYAAYLTQLKYAKQNSRCENFGCVIL